MRASFLVKAGQVEVREIDAPELESDEVLIRVAAVGVCGSDTHYYQHGKIGPYVVDEPLILGHEASEPSLPWAAQCRTTALVSEFPLNRSDLARTVNNASPADTTSAHRWSFMPLRQSMVPLPSW